MNKYFEDTTIAYWMIKVILNCNSINLTELTAHVVSFLVTGWIPFKVTTHAPHPPSKHINLVPVRWAWLRIKVFNVVVIGTVFGETNVVNNN